jgi:hypothetical protein
MKDEKSHDPIREYFNLFVFIPGVIVLILGITLFFTGSSEAFRLSIAGVLSGLGAGTVIAEISAAGDRRKLRQKVCILLAQSYADSRNSFYLGDHYFGFIIGNSKSVTAFKEHARRLSITDTEISHLQQGQYDTSLDTLTKVLIHKAENVLKFFELGRFLLAYRNGLNPQNKSDSKDLEKVGGPLIKSLEDVKEWCPTEDVSVLGQHVVKDHLRRKIDDSEAEVFLKSIWIYFAGLGISDPKLKQIESFAIDSKNRNLKNLVSRVSDILRNL